MIAILSQSLEITFCCRSLFYCLSIVFLLPLYYAIKTITINCVGNVMETYRSCELYPKMAPSAETQPANRAISHFLNLLTT